MTLKIDIEKAYDSVGWPFLSDSLKDMEAVTSSSFQILWNGTLSEEFKPTRGIRQGYDLILLSKTTDNQANLVGAILDQFSRFSDHKFIIDKIRNKLNYWVTFNLSLAGWVTLAKASLMTIPNYFMQTVIIPKGVCEQIEQIARRFIWGGSKDKSKMVLVNWNTCCQPMTHGGLGLRSLQGQNESFIVKLGYQLLMRPEALWVKVLKSKYKINETLPITFKTKNCSFVWRSLSRVWDSIRENVTLVPDAIDSCAAVRDFIMGNGDWDLNNLRVLFDEETVRYINAIPVPRDDLGEDLPMWRWHQSGKCTVKTAFSVLNRSNWDTENKLWNLAWEFDGWQRIRQFLWLILHNRLMTNVERTRRGLTMDSTCPTSREGDETISHVLWECPKARMALIRMLTTGGTFLGY
ncbi:hypothetical protein F3Y22_tig00117021pilonHSYRG00092 [Hibiscus syriacus]|uniref:Reverse transcriptase zinc-binding domain-containing protein n=1 Tax=Hibiscus syriacus TaxID=106335 RepID=A0A6A2WI51_HIBSY|nr:hypothetical protein F3Y22_tig00117021pilonHSYRG00092 [Hibiscus syriacus]